MSVYDELSHLMFAYIMAVQDAKIIYSVDPQSEDLPDKIADLAELQDKIINQFSTLSGFDDVQDDVEYFDDDDDDDLSDMIDQYKSRVDDYWEAAE